MKGTFCSRLISGFCSFLLVLGVAFSSAGQEIAQPAAAPAAVAPAVADAGGAELIQGEAVFNANCKQCHAFNEVVVGPALAGVLGRWPSEAAMGQFIKYPQKVIESGDPYAKALYEKYKQYMPNHDFLSDADLKAVISYIKSGGPKEVVAVAGPGGDAKTGTAEEGASGTTLNLILGLMVVVLFIVLIVLVLMVNILTRSIKTNTEIPVADKAFIEQKSNWGAFFGSPAFRTFVIWVGIFFVAKAGFDKTYAIGINQGYAPAQPIAFSHKLHAGMYEIDCNYCHTGVNRGKRATIPAVNICMNCHNAIKTNSPEIKKIWKAVRTNEPIKWVRVHNLPDLAYFNHAQHVKVGGVECVTCHGDVKQMEVIQQHSTLTMGWCINCHRQTAVKGEGNAYYDKLLILHKESKKGDMHVADIGGLECSKCHY